MKHEVFQIIGDSPAKLHFREPRDKGGTSRVPGLDLDPYRHETRIGKGPGHPRENLCFIPADVDFHMVGLRDRSLGD